MATGASGSGVLSPTTDRFLTSFLYRSYPKPKMPGIVGLITKRPRESAELELQRMLETMLHEPFYTHGMWMDGSLGVYAGWVARKDSFADGMPLVNERSGLRLIFSGEEYSGGLDELLRACEKDAAFPANLNGRFHGLVIDAVGGAATLFNDRYGMHRVYIHEAADAFYFSAEAKAILAVRPELRELDARSLGEFVACGAALEGRTLFKGIGLLPGGARWIFHQGSSAKKEAYFKPEDWENQEPLEAEKFYPELRDQFARALPRYFAGRERIAMSITGGLDTRMVMAWQKSKPGALPCYTFGGPLRECKDVILGRKIAALCGQPHQVIPVGEDFFNRFSDYAARAVYLTDGCAGVNHAPDLYLNEKARDVAPVRMTGLYGDEVLRRFRAFKPESPAPGLFHPEFFARIREAEATYNKIAACRPLSFAVFKQGPWYHYGSLSLEQTQVAMRTPFLDNDLVRTVFRAPESAVTSREVTLRLIGDGSHALLKYPTDRGVSLNGGGFVGGLSHAYLEFLFKAEYAYDMGMPQWLARADHALAPFHFERLFLGRHKPFHFRVWYRDRLAKEVRDILLDSTSLSRPYIERRSVEAVVEGHLRGNRNYTNEIHTLLTLELIHRVLLDSSREAPGKPR